MLSRSVQQTKMFHFDRDSKQRSHGIQSPGRKQVNRAKRSARPIFLHWFNSSLTEPGGNVAMPWALASRVTAVV